MIVAHVVSIDKHLDSTNTGVVRVIVDDRVFPFLGIYGPCQLMKSLYLKQCLLTWQSRYYHRASEERTKVLMVALEELDYLSTIFVSRAHRRHNNVTEDAIDDKVNLILACFELDITEDG